MTKVNREYVRSFGTVLYKLELLENDGYIFWCNICNYWEKKEFIMENV